MQKIIKQYTAHKFGGTSLSQAINFKSVCEILSDENQIIIVSATAGTTNLLQQALDKSQQRCDFNLELAELKNSHVQIIKDLFLEETQHKLISQVSQNIAAIAEILKSVCLVGSYSPQVGASVLGYGECWSASILAACLARDYETLCLDARQVLFIDDSSEITEVDWEKSQKALARFLQGKIFDKMVITGFVASNMIGEPATLGRNGSDFSAAIFAKLFKSKQLTIWTDVDGIYSADPKRVRLAFPIKSLSFAEALELAYFGAGVLHPNAIMPAIEDNITLLIKNSMKSSEPGTRITADKVVNQHVVQGLSSIDSVAMLNVEGAGMMGVSGVAARAFEALHAAGISIILISQASSEHSICFVISQLQKESAIAKLQHEFELEIKCGLIQKISVDPGCAVLAIVGDGMVGSPGIAGKLCHTLAQANINIRAIAQGSSERNISIVVRDKDINRALRAVHAGFYLSHKTISIGLIGPGLVGKTLLEQITHSLCSLREKYNVNLSVRAIMNSKKMLLSEQSIDLEHWDEQLAETKQQVCMDSFVNHILSDDIPHAVIIDSTANQQVADQYEKFIAAGVHVITPNKRANSGDLDYYHRIKTLARKNNRHYLYGTTVCAGLPVLETLQDLIKTGDKINQVSGVVSGTLAYIFSQLSTGKDFSKIIKAAKKAGYTEPDPRDDLSGMDVARKFVCLARELGYAANLVDVKVHNLVPVELQSVSIDEFLERLENHDSAISELLSSRVSEGERASYVGTIDNSGKITVEIKGFSEDHPFSRMNGTDNMLIIYSDRYKEQPLVIQGPGAGAEVTAAGVFADLLRLCSFLSA